MIRIYGPSLGESSFRQVTRGMERAAQLSGLLSGTVPMDALNDYTAYPGANAAMSLNCGAPMMTAISHRMGQHRRHWLLLAPNGETLPPKLIEALLWKSDIAPNGLVDGILAPSAWGAEVVKRSFPGLPVRVAPHGVIPGIHYVRAEYREQIGESYADGGFHVLHMTSTKFDRKSTRALLTAWKQVAKENWSLTIVTQDSELKWFAEDLGVKGVIFDGGVGRTQKQIATMYSLVHAVCQPSRAEGFGLVPVEALACGVPVIATRCTGHLEWFDVKLPGAVEVHHGAIEPLDEFDGALAPSVAAKDIAEMLVVTHMYWEHLSRAAEANAKSFAEEWSWEAKNADVLRLCAAEAREGETNA